MEFISRTIQGIASLVERVEIILRDAVNVYC